MQLTGCADRAPAAAPPAPAATEAAPSFQARMLAAQARATAAAAARRSAKLPPAVAMPGGGIRIDLRGSTKHVRTLELQPDGSYRHACLDAPEIRGPGATP